MRDRLPVYIEDRELPKDEFWKETDDRNGSFGYVNILFLISIIITIASVVTVIIFKR